MPTTHTHFQDRNPRIVRPLLVVVIAVALVSLNLHSSRVAGASSEQTIVLQIDGAPLLQGSSQVVSNAPGNQGGPRASCNLVSYSAVDPQGAALTIHYQDLVTGSDNVIPGNQVDFLSDISGSYVAYWEGAGPEDHVMVFDTTSHTRTQIPGVQNSYPSIGGNLVAYEDRSSSYSWLMADISVYDLSTGTVTRLTNDSLSNLRPSVSPNGNAVVWQKCDNLGHGCAVYAALQTAAGVFTTRALTEPNGNYHATTNGEIAVYLSGRSGTQDIYYQPLTGGAEVHLDIPGPQLSARISGDLITFESQDLSDFDVDVYVYNIRTGKLFQVTNTPVFETQSDIDVCNGVGRIVYADQEGPNYHVYAFSFQVPNTPEDQIDDLTTLIGSFNLPPGSGNSLITKLQAALTAIESGDIATACSSLTAFKNECAAQSGKKLTSDQATQLINSTNQIKSALGCP